MNNVAIDPPPPLSDEELTALENAFEVIKARINAFGIIYNPTVETLYVAHKRIEDLLDEEYIHAHRALRKAKRDSNE